ncbi:hypothetical protein OKA05_25855 [Luteolibacter arcticus]|uniref:RHS repeat protein n=1 Tax=Luteolibacter arcticus TaxID=1581411 RepID=A0ABT3GR80_9BACT|nr:hypothetical protein [Luteolibacter arcticus]MCW1926010.1 hypothetical protein [Luteolibacter arcticus]
MVSLSSVHAQCGGTCGTPGTQTLKFSGSAQVKSGSITVSMYNPETGNNVTVTDSESGEALAQTPEGSIPIKPGDPYTGTVEVVSQPLSGSGCGTVATVVLDPGSTCGYLVECCTVTGGVDGAWSENLTLTFPVIALGGAITGTYKVRITKEADENKEEEDDEDDSETEEDSSYTRTSPPSIPENEQDVPPLVDGGPPTAQPSMAAFSHTVDLGATPQTAGRNAGSLILAASITEGAANPDLLKVTNSFGLAAPEFEVIPNPDTPEIIGQVKTDACLAKVLSIEDGFQILIYQAGDFVVPRQPNQLYATIDGRLPVREYTYSKVYPASGHQGGISITTQTAGGSPRTRVYLSTSGTGDAWRIVGPGGLQVTDYVSNFHYDEDYDGTKDRWIRTDEETVSRSGIAYSETERDYQYQVLRQGTAVVQSHQFLLEERRSVSPTEPDLITTYEPHPDFLGQAKSVTRSDGSWEVYDYYDASSGWRGRTKTVLRPWNGLPVLPSDATASTPTQNCEVTTFTYTSGSNGGLVVDEEVTTLPVVGTVKKETTAPAWVPVTGTGGNPGVADLLLLAGIHSEWAPAAVNIQETSRHRWASASESLRSTRLSYVRGTGPVRPWQGRSAGSIDSDLRGSLTGYELGTYAAGVFTPNTTANGGTGTHVRAITVEVQGEVDGTPSFAFLELGESTKTEVIEDEDGRVLSEQLFVRTGTGSWSPATDTTYEYGFWPNGSVKEVTRKHDGRIVERTLEVSRYETHSWDEQGIETREVRDALGRTLSVTKVGIVGSQPDVVTSYTYSGRTVTRTSLAARFP